MQRLTLSVDHNLYERTLHGTRGYPLKLYTTEVAGYEAGQVPWHWHNEVELVVVLRGQPCYHIGEETVTLQEGEGIFINANILHMIDQAPGGQAVILAILFEPAFICGQPGSDIAKKYVDPVTSCAELPFLRLRPQTGWQAELLDLLNTAGAAEQAGGYGSELSVRNALSSFWRTLAINTRHLTGASAESKVSPDNRRIKQMMQFIQSNYAGAVTLDQIAAAARVSVSECCRCFGRTLGMTPFEYLLQYRVNAAARLLVDTPCTVTEIAHDVGFETPSYFGKKFKARFGCTPSQYRKNALG